MGFNKYSSRPHFLISIGPNSFPSFHFSLHPMFSWSPFLPAFLCIMCGCLFVFHLFFSIAKESRYLLLNSYETQGEYWFLDLAVCGIYFTSDLADDFRFSSFYFTIQSWVCWYLRIATLAFFIPK